MKIVCAGDRITRGQASRQGERFKTRPSGVGIIGATRAVARRIP
jgi:hypothetical protein